MRPSTETTKGVKVRRCSRQAARYFWYVLNTPQNFLDEVAAGPAVYVEDVNRDNGDPALAEDWLGLCGFDKYSPATVPFVGLFLDVSGSLTKDQVLASYNLFYANAAAAGLTIQEVFNNWIDPFLTTLVPPTP